MIVFWLVWMVVELFLNQLIRKVSGKVLRKGERLQTQPQGQYPLPLAPRTPPERTLPHIQRHGGDGMNNCSASSAKQVTVDAETLEQLPPLYREIANILIERGEWVLITPGGDREA